MEQLNDKLISLSIPGPSGTSVKIQTPENIPSGSQFTIGSLATGFLQVIMVLGIFLSLFYLVYGGFFWIQSKGDKQTLDKARRIITYSILGLIIMSLALIIINVIATAFGIETMGLWF